MTARSSFILVFFISMEIPEEKVFMKLGVPKEKNSEESRVAITPDIAKTLISTGLEVIVESGAGDRANFSDDMYIESGASIRDSLNTLSCDVVIKVTRPSLSEVDAMIEGGIFIGLMEYCKNEDLNQKMADKNISVIALEKIPRISRAQSMDVLSSQANIAGYRAVIEAASHFGRFVPLMMTSAGGCCEVALAAAGETLEDVRVRKERHHPGNRGGPGAVGVRRGVRGPETRARPARR